MRKVYPRRKGEQTNKNDLVLTPGGWRPKSKVYHVEPGYHIDGGGGRLKIIHTATGKVIADLGETPEGDVVRRKKIRSGTGKKKEETGL